MGFDAVDKAPLPDEHIAYLRWADGYLPIRRYKDVALRYLAPAVGSRALDLGCGLGSDLRALASQLGESGLAVGVDLSARMLEQARRHCANARLVQADLRALPFADAHFSAARCDRVLVHVAEPADAIAEIHRVLAPGARAIFLEGDFEALDIDHPDPRGTAAVRAAFAASVRWGAIGSELPFLLRSAGFELQRVEQMPVEFAHLEDAEQFLHLADALAAAVGLGAMNPPRAAVWHLELARMDAAGHFRASLPGVGVLVRKV